MKKIFSIFVLVFVFVFVCKAQSVDGGTYSLPKTGIRMTMLVEKSVYTPGELALYARKYLRDSNVDLEAKTTYSLVAGEMSLYAEPDTSKIHTAHIDPKHNFQKISLSDDGILLAINKEPKVPETLAPFTPAPKAKPVDVRKYLSQDILSVGSKMKMAELVAKEIYDIRESRSELTRGQADYMPKDGEQLKLMLASLDEQELALRQMFEGTTIIDTTEVIVNFMPEKEGKEVMFRFSENWGLCDAKDLSGSPYYIYIEDLHSIPPVVIDIPEGKKQPKDETGIWINRPGKIRATVIRDGQAWKQKEFSAGQFGETENLNAPLFGRKVETKLILNAYNGGIDSIESEQIK